MVCDDPGAAALAERSAALGVRVLRYGSGPGAELAGALVDWEQQGTGAVAHVQLAGELAPQGDAAGGAGPAHGAQRAGRAAGRGRGRRADRRGDRRPGRFRGRAAPLRTGRHGRRGAGLRRLRPPSDRGACRPDRVARDRPAGPHRARRRSPVPAASSCSSRTCIRGQRLSRASSANALDTADEVFVLDVYAAREQPMAGISGATVAEHVSVPVHYVADFSAVAARVAAVAGDGDVVVTMGAGDVTMLGAGDHRGPAGQGRASRGAPGDDAGAGPGLRAGRGRTTTKPTIGRESTSADVQNVDLGETVDEQPDRSRAPEAETPEEAVEEQDFEGPRRRARRERDERRAAQARAIAIEDARRDAKRRVRSAAVRCTETVEPQGRSRSEDVDLAGRADGDRRRAGTGPVLHPG